MKRRKRRTWIWGLAGIFLLAFAGAVSAYVYATRPDRLRARLVALLSTLDGTRAHVEPPTFSLFSGLEAANVLITWDETAAPASAAARPEDRRILGISRLRVRHNPWMLLLGRFEPVEIIADGARVTLVRRSKDARNRNKWRFDLAGAWSGGALDNLSIPALTATDVDVQIVALEGNRRRVLERRRLDITGRQAGAQYIVELHRSGAGERLAELRWEIGSKNLSGELGWVSLETLSELMPADQFGLPADLRLTGRARVFGGSFRSGLFTAEKLEFENIRCALPVAQADNYVQPQDRFLQFTETAGTAALTREHFTINASGKLNGAAFRCEFTGQLNSANWHASAYRLEINVDEIDLPRQDEPNEAAFIAALPEAVRNFFDNYTPNAKVKLDLQLARKSESQPDAEFRGRMEIVDGSCTYFRFPYRFDRARGTVEFSSDGIRLSNMSGAHGSARVFLNADINHAGKWSGFELNIRAVNVPLERDLYAALPERYQQLWSRTAPIGLCDIEVSLVRPEGSPQTGPLKPQIRIEADLSAVSLNLADGTRITHGDGRIIIDDNGLTIEDLHGYDEYASLQLTGSLKTSDTGEAARLSVRAHAVDLPIRQEAGPADDHAHVGFSGKAEVWASITQDSPTHDPSYQSPSAAPQRKEHYVIRVVSGTLRSGDSPANEWTDATGWVVRHSDQLELIDFRARYGDAWLAASGVIPTAGNADQMPNLELQIGDLPMEMLADLLPSGQAKDVIDRLRLNGAGRLSVHFRPPAPGGNASDASVEVRIEAERMRPDALPLTLTDASASVTLHRGRVRINRASARYGTQGKVLIKGEVNWDDPDARSVFSVAAQKLNIDDEFVAAMPAALRKFLDDLSVRGRADVSLDHLSFDQAENKTWKASGSLALEHAVMDIGLPLTDCDGAVNGRLLLTPDGELQIDADFTIEHALLSKWPLERWEGRIVRDSSGPSIRLEQLRGRLCGGEVIGSAAVNTEAGEYELSLTVNDLSLHEFLARETEDGKPVAGRIDGRLFVEGKLGAKGKRTGGGNIRIREASLLQTPVVGPVVREARKKGALSDQLNFADLRFAFENDDVHLNRVEIQSKDLRLVGAGHWNLANDQIDLTLVGAHPRHWLRVPIISDLVETAGREFVQYRVIGPAKAPTVTIEPLYSLTDPIRRLIERK